MRALGVATFLWVAVLLAACSGGGGDSPKVYCDYLRGLTTFSNNQTGAGEAENTHHSADARLRTFAYITTAVQRSFVYRSRAAESRAYTDLPRAVGAFVTVAPGPSDAVTINTYLDGVLQQSASDAALQRTPTDGKTEAVEFLSLTASQPFDELEMVVNTGSGSEYSIYEFCAHGEVFD